MKKEDRKAYKFPAVTPRTDTGPCWRSLPREPRAISSNRGAQAGLYFPGPGR